MQRIRVQGYDKEFDEWLNSELQKRNIDIIENTKNIQEIVDRFRFEFDTEETRNLMIKMIEKSSIDVRELRKKKLDEIEKR